MYSSDLLWRVVFLWYLHRVAADAIAYSLFISRSTVYRVIERFVRGEPVEGTARFLGLQGRKVRSDRKLSARDRGVLKELINGEASIYLDELADALARRTGTRVSLPTICRALRSGLHYTRKQVRELLSAHSQRAKALARVSSARTHVYLRVVPPRTHCTSAT